MQGLHLTADLYGCTCDIALLTNAKLLGARCLAAVRAAGLQPVAHLFHAFEPTPHIAGDSTTNVAHGNHSCNDNARDSGGNAAGNAGSAAPCGVTATVLLAESHLCIHTWPEQMAVTLDVYVCNFGGDHSAKAQTLMDELLNWFGAARVHRHTLQRGL